MWDSIFLQRLFPKKPIKIALATKKQIVSDLFKIELKDSVKGLVKKIKDELMGGGMLLQEVDQIRSMF